MGFYVNNENFFPVIHQKTSIHRSGTECIHAPQLTNAKNIFVFISLQFILNSSRETRQTTVECVYNWKRMWHLVRICCQHLTIELPSHVLVMMRHEAMTVVVLVVVVMMMMVMVMMTTTMTMTMMMTTTTTATTMLTTMIVMMVMIETVKYIMRWR